MLIHSESYLEHVNLVINKSLNLSIAVAFWGDGSEKLFTQWRGEKARIVCNLMSGGSNPKAIRALLDNPKIELLHTDTLHAKVITGEVGTIIGSANFSTNGLTLESDITGWEEAGIFSADDTLKHDTSSWFESVWKTARKITKSDLSEAENNWKKRRNKRPVLDPHGPLLKQPTSEFKDKDIYVAIYEEVSSDEADKALEDVKNSVNSSTDMEIQVDDKKLTYLEDWSDCESENDLPINSPIICIRRLKKGTYDIEEVGKRIPALDRTFLVDKQESTLQVLSIEDDVAGWKLPNQDHNAFIKRIKSKLDKTDLDESARCIPLYKLMD